MYSMVSASDATFPSDVNEKLFGCLKYSEFNDSKELEVLNNCFFAVSKNFLKQLKTKRRTIY